MVWLSEFAGCFILLAGGYAYMCNISLKKTQIAALNYTELTIAWSLAVGFGLAVSSIMGGPAYLNPGVVLGNVICNGMGIGEAALYLLMEFLAAGAAMLVCMIFFWDSFRASTDAPKRGIFSAYPVEKNLPLNFIQELIATFFFMFIVFMCITGVSDLKAGNQSLIIGMVGFGAVAFLSLSFNSTGYSMNAMRSVFSSIWFTVLPFPNKNGEKVDWKYQLTVNCIGSSMGGILAVMATSYLKSIL